MAMQIAQIIALTYVGMYESKFLLELATEERSSAYLESNHNTLQAFQTELNALESRMQTQINDLANKLNIWQGTSTKKFDELTAAIQKQAQAIADNKDKMEKQLQDEIEKLKENLEKQLAELEEASATKDDVGNLKEELTAQLDALEKDLKDSQKSIEENQKSLDDIKKKFAKSTGELTTKVADLEVFTLTQLSYIEVMIGAIVTDLMQVEENVKCLQKESDDLEEVDVSTFRGRALRWWRGQETAKIILAKRKK
jgi:chromosome segregation ATPase